MAEIKLVRNDKNFTLRFYIKDADGNALDLSDIDSIKLKIQKYGSSSLLAEIPGTVVSATEGIAQFQIGEQFVGQEGEFIAEIEMTFVSGQVLTAPDIYIKVVPDLPR